MGPRIACARGGDKGHEGRGARRRRLWRRAKLALMVTALMATKDEVARELIEHHFAVEPELRAV